jgi:formate/nitrite transporter FocA (FNT family)
VHGRLAVLQRPLTTDKILAIIPPISAFVAAGFEHSVANMYFIPIGLFIKAWAPASFWALPALAGGSSNSSLLCQSDLGQLLHR